MVACIGGGSCGGGVSTSTVGTTRSGGETFGIGLGGSGGVGGGVSGLSSTMMSSGTVGMAMCRVLMEWMKTVATRTWSPVTTATLLALVALPSFRCEKCMAISFFLCSWQEWWGLGLLFYPRKEEQTSVIWKKYIP